MNQRIPYIIKNNKKILELIMSIFAAYLLGQLILRNPLYVLLMVILALMGITLFISKYRIKSISWDTQLLFFFFPLVFIYVTGIPKLGSLPLSPVYFFVGVYLFFFILNPREIFAVLKRPAGKIFLLLLLCWFYQYFFSVTFIQSSFLNMQLFELLGLFFGMNYFIKKSPERALVATRILAIVLVISTAWYVMEILCGGPFTIRSTIYKSILEKEEPWVAYYSVAYPNGLASLRFVFGYQIAVAVPLNIMLFFIEPRRTWRLLWLMGGILSVLAMIFAGERSALFASAAVLLYFFYRRKQFKIVVLTAFIVLVSAYISSRINIKQDVFARVQSEESTIEAWGRMKLQITGMKVALENPWGLVLSGESWSEEAYAAGADFSEWGGREIAVHNGYLGRIIYYGWAYGLLMALVLLRIIKLLRTTFSWSKKKLEGIQYAEIAALALISVLIQALFHNISIFKFNSTSITILFLFLIWFDLITVNNPLVSNLTPQTK